MIITTNTDELSFYYFLLDFKLITKDGIGHNLHRKKQVNHLTHMSHSGSVHGQNDSKMCEK